MNLKIISAGAGSGKTYRLTQEMVQLLKDGVRANGIIATTFTTKAAAELQERVRVKLLEEGLVNEANELTNALIGTVHGLGVKLLKRFAFIAGVSPEVDIIADEDQQILFNKSLASVLLPARIVEMEKYSSRLGLNKNEYYDWRREVKQLTDTARANDFSIAVLEESKQKSVASFQEFLGKKSKKSNEAINQQLEELLNEAIDNLEANEDETKKTQKAVSSLKELRHTLKLRGELNWHEWVKISKIDTAVGAKSKDDVLDLGDFAKAHDTHPAFHQDIKNYIHLIFDIAIEAISEYESYKKQRGLIDYIDMEIQVKRLMDNPQVQEILREELDLLMVDEFQDTSPIQLEIFLKLSQIAKYSIWVGDPKQSIYGFRGADPKLMQEIIRANGGVKKEDIQKFSWRSREDIVYATNAIFTKAFKQLPEEQVALIPKQTIQQNPDDPNFEAEPIAMKDALMHWHFEYDGEGRRLPGKPWMENSIATAIRRLLLEREVKFLPKGEKQTKNIQPGDIAILCRSNKACQEMAKALHHAGLKAAIARNGLLNTPETRLVLACLKYILHRSDSLSVAEILLLAGNQRIEDIIDDRLDYLEKKEQAQHQLLWGENSDFIKRLNALRGQIIELSSTEILNLVMEELDLRRIIAQWGSVSQRMDNIDVLRRFALKYEEGCNRLHTAASLGGFLLYLNELQAKEADQQGSGEGTDAVNVLTYHKSKGLEWPVVICHSLENSLMDKVYGINIISESEQVDLDNVLGNRWLRYWINPYSNQSRGTNVEERINASPQKIAAHQQALQEEARLLYVGITRARDYLVIPTRAKATKWLNRVWQEGNEEQPTLTMDSQETPWDWKGKVLYAAKDNLAFPRDFPQHLPPAENISFLEERAGQQKHLPYLIDPSKEHLKGSFKVDIALDNIYRSAIPLDEGANTYQIAKMIDAFLTADSLRFSNEDRLHHAELLVERFQLDQDLDATLLLSLSDSFYKKLNEQFVIKKVFRKYPIQFHIGQRLFQTTIDILLETDQGFVVIQHNEFSGAKKPRTKKAKELAPWMFLTQKAVQAVFKTSAVSTFIHFCLQGIITEIHIFEKSLTKMT